MDDFVSALINQIMSESGFTDQVAREYALSYICYFISDCADSIPELNDKIQERLSVILNSTPK